MLKRTFFFSPAAFLRCAVVLLYLFFFAIVPAQAQWQQTNTPNGTEIHAFTSIGTNVFAGGSIGFKTCVFLTTDNGVTWTNTNLPSVPGRIWTLLADDQNLFAGADGGYFFLSTNNGATWVTGGRIPTISIRSIDTIGSILFAGTYRQGIYRSTDSGATWTAVNNGLIYDSIIGGYESINALASIGTNLFAAGVLRSTDSGSTWTSSDSGLPNGGVYALTVIDSNLYLADDQFGVYLSTDNSTNWIAVNNNLPSIDTGNEVGTLTVSCSNIFVGTFYGIFRASNPPSSWVPVNNGLPINYANEYALGVGNGYLFAAPWGGDTIGVWRLPLDEVILDEHPPGDSLQATLCDPTNLSFDLQTIGGCTNVTLDSVIIAGLDSAEYQIARTYHPDGPDTSWITVNPTESGVNSFTINVQYTHDSNVVSDTSFTVALNVSPAQSLSINLPPDQLSDTDQGTVSIPIYASSLGTVTGGSVTFRINMRTDLLTPESISTTLPGAGTAPLQVDDSGVWITLTLPSNFSISSDTLIATLVCHAYVTDTNETAISVASSSGTSNCLSILGTGGETFTLTPQCGDPTLTQFLTSSLPFYIESIQPNPARDEIIIHVDAADPGSIPSAAAAGVGSSHASDYHAIECQMYDELGRGEDVRSTSLQSGLSLDVSGVPSGIYFIRVSAGGYVESRSVVIQH